MLVRALALVMLVASIGAAAPKPRSRPAPKPRWQTLPLPPAMPAATTSGTVEVGGARIYYAIYGTGDPVILLHGGLGNSDHFGFQLPALIDKFQVIAIDSPRAGPEHAEPSRSSATT